MRRAALLAALAAFALAACGERPQVVQYKQGTYQGKPDQAPWAGAPYNGDKAKWESDLRTRMQQQNEYKRTS